MDVKQRLAVGVNNFVLELGAYTPPFISRGRFWARFGMVGIVGLGWAGFERMQVKRREKRNTRGSGCDDKSFHFFFNTIPIYSV